MADHNRRTFLGVLSTALLGPFVVNAELLRAGPDVSPAMVPVTTSDGTVTNSPLWMSEDGNLYRYIKAHKTLDMGDIVCVEKDVPFGVAIGRIDAGNYGFVCVSTNPHGGRPVAVRMVPR